MKSYIERAIEMAKSQRKHGEAAAEFDDEAQSSPRPERLRSRRRQSTAAPATDGRSTTSTHLPPINLANAPAIVTDTGLLRQNRVLVESDSAQPAGNAYRMLRTRVLRQMRSPVATPGHHGIEAGRQDSCDWRSQLPPSARSQSYSC